MAKSFDVLVRRTTSKRVQARATARTRELLGEMLVSELRKVSGRSQRELASALGIKQPSVSKMEQQSDLQLSTLQRIVQALGGELEIVARFPHRAVTIQQTARKRLNRAPTPATTRT